MVATQRAPLSPPILMPPPCGGVPAASWADARVVARRDCRDTGAAELLPELREVLASAAELSRGSVEGRSPAPGSVPPELQVCAATRPLVPLPPCPLSPTRIVSDVFPGRSLCAYMKARA